MKKKNFLILFHFHVKVKNNLKRYKIKFFIIIAEPIKHYRDNFSDEDDNLSDDDDDDLVVLPSRSVQ